MPMFPTVDEDGLPTKGTSGTPGGYTGGGGGGPGGGSFGFGGGGLGVAFAPGGMRGVFGVDGQQRRRLGMPAVPGVTPGAPQPSDTVPAMLTPGEIVMNNGVTSDPQLAQALTHLNMMGAQRMMQPQGFAYGGRACGMAYGGEVPHPEPMHPYHAALVRSMLMGGGMPAAAPAGGGGGIGSTAGGGGMVTEGYAYGGHVNPFLMALRYMNMPAGYAYGGNVGQMQQNGFFGSAFNRAQQGMNRMMPNAMGRSTAAPAAGAPAGTANLLSFDPRNPYAVMSQSYDPTARRAGVHPGQLRAQSRALPLRPGVRQGSAGGLFTSNGSWTSVDPRNADQKKAGVWTDPQGNVRNSEGNLLSFDPRNPYAVMSQSYDPTARGVGMRQMGAFGEAGYWDPNGNQALMNSVRGEALANARAQQQGAGLRAQLARMDPGAAASYRLEAGLRGSSDVARALNNARTQSMLAQQNYANSLAGSLLSNQNQQLIMQNQMRNQDLLNNNQYERQRGDQWGAIGGQILGTGLGAFAGGLGSGLASNLTGGNKPKPRGV